MEKIWAIRVGDPNIHRVYYMREFFDTRKEAEAFKLQYHHGNKGTWKVVRLKEVLK